MPADWISFELQRRINQPEDDVRRALSSPAILGAGMTLPLGGEGLLVLQAPFRPAPFPDMHALHAPAVLTSSRGRRVALVRLEITPWSSDATALALRPLSSRPDHWSARRIHQYFELAHQCADTIARLVAEEAAAHHEAGQHSERGIS